MVSVPPLQTRPKAALVGVGRHVILRPAVVKRYVELEEPTMEDQRSDVQRLLDAIDDLEPHIPLDVVRKLGGVLRARDFKVTAVVVDEEMIDVEPGDTTGARHALAFDLGTTTVVATLLDLDSGQPLAVQLAAQRPAALRRRRHLAHLGDDDGPGALDTLRSRAHETMAALADEVCEEAGIAPEQVYEITVCGNATMMHLALGIDPEPLSMAPFTVTTHELARDAASDFGVVVHPRAPAFVFPSLGAYVGGDIVAGMLATGLTRDRRLRLFIDVGTNSEIALGCEERVLATAAPAGPAFEAAQIRCGMRAAEGAIEGVRIAGRRRRAAGHRRRRARRAVRLRSGRLRGRAGALRAARPLRALHPRRGRGRAPARARAAADQDRRGARLRHALARRGPGDSIFLSQRDVRELQFAKASIATGWKILLASSASSPATSSRCCWPAASAPTSPPPAPCASGSCPRLALPRIVSAGNVAGEGAKIVALSHRERAEARRSCARCEYVELSGRADFNDLFVDELALPG